MNICPTCGSYVHEERCPVYAEERARGWRLFWVRMALALVAVLFGVMTL